MAGITVTTTPPVLTEQPVSAVTGVPASPFSLTGSLGSEILNSTLGGTNTSGGSLGSLNIPTNLYPYSTSGSNQSGGSSNQSSGQSWGYSNQGSSGGSDYQSTGSSTGQSTYGSTGSSSGFSGLPEGYASQILFSVIPELVSRAGNMEGVIDDATNMGLSQLQSQMRIATPNIMQDTLNSLASRNIVGGGLGGQILSNVMSGISERYEPAAMEIIKEGMNARISVPQMLGSLAELGKFSESESLQDSSGQSTQSSQQQASGVSSQSSTGGSQYGSNQQSSGGSSYGGSSSSYQANPWQPYSDMLNWLGNVMM